MRAPAASTRAARLLETAGLTELMSTYTLPSDNPASTPSGPSVTDRSASLSVTIVNTTSPASAASRGVSAHRIPSAISQSALDRVRLVPVTS